MLNFLPFLLIALAAAPCAARQNEPHQADTIKGQTGEITIKCLGHASLLISFKGKQIYVDPWSEQADFTLLPKADLVLITHEHFDHLDKTALKQIAKPDTKIICSEGVAKEGVDGHVCRNGDRVSLDYIEIEAVPVYNIMHKKPDGTHFHPKGAGNGYVITIDGVKILAAGDTENTPELEALRGIDVAFLPMNLPFTMTPEMVAHAAISMKPKILYPYHYGSTDTKKLVELLKDHPEIEVRIRRF